MFNDKDKNNVLSFVERKRKIDVYLNKINNVIDIGGRSTPNDLTVEQGNKVLI